MAIVDIRQSELWSEYLKLYGWQSINLTGGQILRLSSFKLFSLAKLQRPLNLSTGDLLEVADLCKHHKVLFTKLSPTPNQDVSVLPKFDYNRAGSIDLPPRTMYIELHRTEADLWESLKGGCRYSINKSNEAKDRTELIQNPSEEVVTKHFLVVRERASRIGYYHPNLTDHLAKARIFGNQAYIGNIYNSSGALLATKMFLGFNKAVWYMHAGLTELGRTSEGGYKLLWDALVYFKGLGYTMMDLEGLDDPRLKRQTKKWAGYSVYKSKFNGTVVEFPLPYVKWFY